MKLSFIFHAIIVCQKNFAKGFSFDTPMRGIMSMMGTGEQGHCFLRPTKTGKAPAALILLPGCFMKPEQYEDVARAIQERSETSLWVVIPKLLFGMANPLTIGHTVTQAMKDLKRAGYAGDEVIVGGHSLGATFLPDTVRSLNMESYVQGQLRVAGTVALGSFQTRDQAAGNDFLPSLTLVGDLDGLIRTSRIAEDFYNNVATKKGNAEDVRLHHSVVVVEGMNHFQYTSGKHPPMEKLRDLQPELTDKSAVQAVASVVAPFMDFHTLGDKAKMQKASLLTKIQETETFLQPLMEAMLLEGSYHIADPCHVCEKDDSCDLDDGLCQVGSPWVEQLQLGIVQSSPTLNGKVASIRDEFRQSWWINPFADPPFYHPHVALSHEGSPTIDIGSITEAVYEKLDFVFDGGLVSNTALELRAKLNSPQAMMKALGVDAAVFESSAPDGVFSKMNRKTIEWAIAHAPAVARKRYHKQGRKLVIGAEIQHNSGPAWIWSHLDFSNCNEDGECIIDTHVMNTPLDHPIPHAGGKLYGKILSPARVLDWMYTDSMRPVAKRASKTRRRGIVNGRNERLAPSFVGFDHGAMSFSPSNFTSVSQ